jgi:competence protein ComEC
MHLLVTFSIAVMLTGLQRELFPPFFSVGILLLSVVFLLVAFAKRKPLLCGLVAAFLFGIAYANLTAWRYLEARLPEHNEKTNQELTIQVSNLPVRKGRYQQFRAGPLLLNWYGEEPVEPCSTWQVTARLKRPHGMANPGGFDYEAYLMAEGVTAKGYLRSGKEISREEGFCLHRLRQEWNRYVEARLPRETAAWVIALSSGSQELLSAGQQKLLTQTGIAHLFVISGSHIALCAAVFYALVLGLRRIGGGILFPGDWRPAAALLAILCAGGYSALAGFGIPVQRSLIMLVVFLLGEVIGIRSSLWLRYWLSMALVLLANPLSFLNTGFALSFAAVFVLIVVAQTVDSVTLPSSLFQRGKEWLRLLVVTQGYISLALLPFTLLFFSGASLLAPLINLLAIPPVSLLITPAILFALLGWLVSGSDFHLLDLSAALLEWLFRIIGELHQSTVGMELLWLGLPQGEAGFALLIFAVLLFLVPKVFQLRGFALLLLLALVLASPKPVVEEGGVVVEVLDVEQGLAVLLRTRHHALLYDSGSSWPDGSMAEMVIVPVLAHAGISQLDRLVISHNDNDHAGGVGDLLASGKVREVIGSEPLPGVVMGGCRKGMEWEWDGVRFSFLHPEEGDLQEKRNNRSCVLLVEAAGRRLLLPGDVDTSVELQLLAAGLPAIDLLVSPHHGSKSSSSAELVANMAHDGRVVISSGYLNRYRHPHPAVEARYQEAGLSVVNTALQGAVGVRVEPSGAIAVSSWREENGRYWNRIFRTENR